MSIGKASAPPTPSYGSIAGRLLHLRHRFQVRAAILDSISHLN